MSQLTPEQRSQLGKNAAQRRWSGPSPTLSITEIKDIVLFDGDIVLPCAVLPGEIRVLTQNGFLKAVGRTGRPSRKAVVGDREMPPMLDAENISPYITDEILEICAPIPFQAKPGHYSWGYRAELLPLVCDVYLRAREENALMTNQLPIAKACEILVRGLAKVGIIALVDEATGYQKEREKNALARLLEAYIAKELQPYVRTFPLEYYESLFRLRGLQFSASNVKRPQYFGVLTNDIIYSRLPFGVLEELKKVIPRNVNGRPTAKYFQKLTSNLGYPKLREHLGGVVMLMRMSKNYSEFRSLLDKHCPKGGQMALDLYDPKTDLGEGL